MKRAWIIACCCAAFVSIAAFAETPSPAPLSQEALTAILGPSAVAGSCATQPAGVRLAAKRPNLGQKPPTAGQEKSVCNATANCWDGSTRSCGGNSTCSSTDSNCDAGVQGGVVCDGVASNCPVCPCNDRPVCCTCDRTGDCFACCRCDGGGIGFCAQVC